MLAGGPFGENVFLETKKVIYLLIIFNLPSVYAEGGKPGNARTQKKDGKEIQYRYEDGFCNFRRRRRYLNALNIEEFEEQEKQLDGSLRTDSNSDNRKPRIFFNVFKQNDGEYPPVTLYTTTHVVHMVTDFTTNPDNFLRFHFLCNTVEDMYLAIRCP